MITSAVIQAALTDAANNNVWDLIKAGAPVNGTSGDGANFAGPGSWLTDITNKNVYMNTGTIASPTWTLQTLSNLSGDVTVTGGVATIGAGAVSSGKIAPGVIQTATGQISSAAITGTAAGQLGNVNGVVLVPAAPAKSVNILLSATIAMDFATAAYTGGGNTSINISGGGAALTGVVATGTFIQAAADVIIDLAPLAASNLNYGTGANGLALVTTVAPTNPGTAAGVINWQVTYQTIAALID